MPRVVAPTLRHAVALGIFGVRGAPRAPVVTVIGRPDPLRARLIGAVILVVLAFVLLPAPPPLTLARSLTAIQLPGGLRARPERLLAGRATPTLHALASALLAKREAWTDRRQRKPHVSLARPSPGGGRHLGQFK